MTEVEAIRQRLKTEIHTRIQAWMLTGDPDPVASLLTGMSLASDFLAKNDGHPIVTAQFVFSVVHEVSAEIGFETGRIGQPPGHRD